MEKKNRTKFGEDWRVIRNLLSYARIQKKMQKSSLPMRSKWFPKYVNINIVSGYWSLKIYYWLVKIPYWSITIYVTIFVGSKWRICWAVNLPPIELKDNCLHWFPSNDSKQLMNKTWSQKQTSDVNFWLETPELKSDIKV